MSDTLPVELTDKTPAETPAAQVANPPAQSATPAAESAEEPFDKDRAMKLIEKFRAQEKDWKKQEKELESLRAKEQQRTEAEMTEAQKLQAQAEKLTAENAKLKADLLKREVVAETGLPSILADRLQGATKEELLADAAKLLEVLPKQKPTPTLGATNPANGQQSDSLQKIRERREARQSSPFEVNMATSLGGGVIYPKE